jgi:hypothetical protein
MKRNVRTRIRKYYFYKKQMEGEIVLTGIGESPISAMFISGSWLYNEELQVLYIRGNQHRVTYRVKEA